MRSSSTRRNIDEPPGTELKDYEEYAHLYRLAWIDPANRWLLSTLPSAMIFDDHDIRDDWNTSQQWQEMQATPWWHQPDRGPDSARTGSTSTAATSPQRSADDEIWQAHRRHQRAGRTSLDLSDVLDAFAERADEKPETYRWS